MPLPDQADGESLEEYEQACEENRAKLAKMYAHLAKSDSDVPAILQAIPMHASRAARTVALPRISAAVSDAKERQHMTPHPTPEELDASEESLQELLDSAGPSRFVALEFITRNAQCRRLLADVQRLREALSAYVPTENHQCTCFRAIHTIGAEEHCWNCRRYRAARAALQETEPTDPA